jgi:hypothetical protein
MTKKPTFTYKQALLERSPTKDLVSSKISRAQQLQSTDPETFGNSATFQNMFRSSFDPKELNSAKKLSLVEKLTLSTWNRISGSAAKKQPEAPKKSNK